MATKTKATPQSSRQTKESSAPGNGRESTVIEESGIDQIVEEVPGTIEDVSGGGFDSEFSESDKHHPVNSPERRESVKATVTESDPMVDAAFAKFSSLHDEQEFWGILARAIGPQVLNVMRRTSVKGTEASQTESASPDDQREFWGAIAGALAPVVMPYAKKIAVRAGKTGLSWLAKSLESQQESGEDLDALAPQLENLFVQQASSGSKESSNGSAREEREFWGFVARNIIPALSPLAKAAAGASVRAGTKIVKGALTKLTPQIISVLRREGFNESDIERMERAQEVESNDSMGEQREFWGAIAGAIVPALMPYAKKLAGAAVKTGGAWIRRRLESSQRESAQGLEGYSQLEELFIEQATKNARESASVSPAEQREFWRSIARKIVPALAPVAKAAATAATRAGTTWVRKMIFESSQQESGQENGTLLEPLEEMLLEEATQMQRESGSPTSESEREFWRSIVKKLSPVLAPVAKSLAGTAVKTGKAVVTGTLRKLNAKTANMLRMAGITEYAIQQLETGNQTPGNGQPEVSEREFWRSIARTIVPIVKPIAHKLGKTAVSTGGKLIKRGISSLFESTQESGNPEQVREAFIEQLEALEVIIGEDDRVQVTATADSPFNRICHLSIMAGDGSAFLGTGFFIGPRTIITAGHCVYDPDHGGWPQQIVVSPGRNGTNKPFGQFVATKFGSVEGWIENQDRDCDYGVIHLSENDRVPSQIGSFGYGIFSDEYLANNHLHIAGYPGDQPSGTMMFHSREAMDVSSTTVVYDIDTVGGQSGSPVYDENRRVVAIHTNGSSSGNSATRITLPVFTNLSQWRLDGD